MPMKPITELKSQVGESYVTVEDFEIEAGKVEEFARAIGDDNPAHGDEAAANTQGFEEIPAPLTFIRTAYFPRYRPDDIEEIRPFDLGFHPEYSVHGEQEYEFERPLYVGDVLTGEVELTNVYQREGSRGGTMTFAEYRFEYRDEDGNLVLTERQTVIETGGAIDEPEDGENGGGESK
jgi:acyl dehydratase